MVEVRAVERMEVVAQVAEVWVGEGRAEVAQAGEAWAAVALVVEVAERGWRTSPGWRWAGRDR